VRSTFRGTTVTSRDDSLVINYDGTNLSTQALREETKELSHSHVVKVPLAKDISFSCAMPVFTGHASASLHMNFLRGTRCDNRVFKRRFLDSHISHSPFQWDFPKWAYKAFLAIWAISVRAKSEAFAT
jgi:hypothetical protein